MMTAASIMLIYVGWSNRPGPDDTGRPEIAEYRVGEKFAEVSALPPSEAPLTLILYIRSGCKFCSASMDFYKRVMAQSRRARVVAISTDSQPILAGYVAAYDLSPDEVVSIRSLPKLRGTPTLLLVDKSGIVEAIWKGQIRTAAAENELIKRISN